MENPWNVQSIYELQYFNCPSCTFKDNSKQEFINHACETHPESIEHLKNIQGKSLADIVLPWGEIAVQIIKNEPISESESFQDNIKESITDPLSMPHHESENNLGSINTNISEKIGDTEMETKHKPNRNYKSEELLNETFDKRYICQICKKTVKDLTLHIKNVHEGINDQISVSKANIKVNNGIKYKCLLCNKSFCHKSSLRIHVRQKHQGQCF